MKAGHITNVPKFVYFELEGAGPKCHVPVETDLMDTPIFVRTESRKAGGNLMKSL